MLLAMFSTFLRLVPAKPSTQRDITCVVSVVLSLVTLSDGKNEAATADLLRAIRVVQSRYIVWSSFLCLMMHTIFSTEKWTLCLKELKR